jgi:RNA polymerase sigma-70 factor (ECF subfamily)
MRADGGGTIVAQTEDRLEGLSTWWSVLFEAHGTSAELARAAQERLLDRYGPAVRRYLLAAVRDPHTADDLFGEFALRLVRGDFRQARPELGRFRQLLKVALYRMVIDHQRRQVHRPMPLAAEPAADPPEPFAESDRVFQAEWRAQLFDASWAALRAEEERTGRPLYTLLRYRTDHPDERAAEMAARLAERLGPDADADWVRRRLFDARQHFTDAVVAEVARSLDPPTPERLAEELTELELLDYCRAALARWSGG